MIREYLHSSARVARLCCVATLLLDVVASCGSPHTAGAGARDAGQSAGSTAADSGAPQAAEAGVPTGQHASAGQSAGSPAAPVVAGRDATPGEPGKRACQSDADCRMQADYCTGCDCEALGPGENVRGCAGSAVSCLVDPCAGKSVLCVRGQCLAE